MRETRDNARMSEPIRLSKAVIALTGCSRRESELYIEGGWVTVDGELVDAPQFMVAEGQQVDLLPDARAEEAEPVTILLHKPAGTESDAGESRAATLLGADTRVVEHTEPPMRVLRRHFTRLDVPMPLAREASGLLVLTQDWQVKRKLTEDAGKLEQEYVVEVGGTIAEGGLERLNRGESSGKWKLPGCKVSWQSENRLRFAGKDLSGERIATMCASVGLAASAIKRIRIGSIAMARLHPGQWRYLHKGKRF